MRRVKVPPEMLARAKVLQTRLPPPSRRTAGNSHEPGRVTTLEIPGWRPTLLNEILWKHWSVAARRKKADKAAVESAVREANLPPACGKRRVRIRVEWPFRVIPDPDSVWKSALDALKHAEMLVDDSADFCEIASPEFVKSRDKKTVITLTDI